MLAPSAISGRREPWNKGRLVGQKAPLKLRDIWAIRVRLEMTDCKRELALFNMAIDSKLRGCDLVQLRVRDVAHGDRIAARTHHHATEDAAAGSIRNYGADAKIGIRLDPAR